LALKGSVMNVRQLAAAAALMLGAVAAQAANTVTFSQFTNPTGDVLVSANSAGLGIVSFSLVDPLPSGALVVPSVFPNAASLFFVNLPGSTYTVRLETLASVPFTLEATGAAGALTMSTVPEPESYALALAGLSVAGLLARRRAV
jgi:PEP-CTERM motif